MIHGYWLILNENFENELKIRVLSFEREGLGRCPPAPRVICEGGFDKWIIVIFCKLSKNLGIVI